MGQALTDALQGKHDAADTDKEDLIKDLEVLLSTNALGIYNLLCGLLNDKLAALVVEELGVDKDADVTSELLEKAVELIKNYTIKSIYKSTDDSK